VRILSKHHHSSRADAPALLSLKDVFAGYSSEIDILKSVSLEMRRNEIVTIIGPNGAGKSTLFETIFGYLKPKRGNIYFDGNEINSLSPQERLKTGIAYVPQERSLFPYLTVEENLRMAGYTLRDEDLVEKRIHEIADRFPIVSSKLHHKATNLSLGEQRALEISRSLMLKPKLVLLDEPSAALSPIYMQVLSEITQSLKQDGLTVGMVEQNVRFGLQAAEWCYVLRLGQVAYDGPAEAILSDDKMRMDLFL
jgi:branched-chain amino acid transport system ATP-binding protein